MFLWDDFWESFFGGIGHSSTGAILGSGVGYTIGGLGGAASARAGAAFGAQLGVTAYTAGGGAGGELVMMADATTAREWGQGNYTTSEIQAGAQTPVLAAPGDQLNEVASGSPSGPSAGAPVKTTITNTAAFSNQEGGTDSAEVIEVWVDGDRMSSGALFFHVPFGGPGYRTSGEVVPGYLDELPNDPHSKVPKTLKDLLREQSTAEYEASLAKVDKAPPPAQYGGETPPQAAPPPTVSPAPPPSSGVTGPTLFEQLQQMYGDQSATPMVQASDDQAVGPPQSFDYQESPSGSAPGAGNAAPGLPDARVSLGPFGSMSAESFLSAHSAPEIGVGRALEWFDSQLPNQGTWQRGVLKGAASFAWGSHPLSRVVSLFSSGYDLLEGWSEEPKELEAYLGDVIDWGGSNGHPTYQVGKMLFGAGAAIESHDPEAIAQIATQLALILISMVAGGRGGGSNKGLFARTMAAARKAADAARKLRPQPARATAITVENGTFAGVADPTKTLDAPVLAALEEIPILDRSPCHSHCSELYVASDATRAGAKGGYVVTVFVRDKGDPVHGRWDYPCKSCAAVLRKLGFKVLKWF